MTPLDSYERTRDTGYGNDRRGEASREAGDPALNPSSAYAVPSITRAWVDVAKLYLPLNVSSVASIIDLLVEDFEGRQLVVRQSSDSDVMEVGYWTAVEP